MMAHNEQFCSLNVGMRKETQLVSFKSLGNAKAQPKLQLQHIKAERTVYIVLEKSLIHSGNLLLALESAGIWLKFNLL